MKGAKGVGVMNDLIMFITHPGVIMIGTGILIILLPAGAARYLLPSGALASLAAMAFSGWENLPVIHFAGGLELSLSLRDQISGFFGLAFGVAAVIGAVYSMDKGRKGEKGAFAVYGGSALMTVFAGNMLTFIIFWEAMTLSSLYMVFKGNGPDAVRSSYRYGVMHLFGGNALLAGIMLMPGEITAAVGPVQWDNSLACWLMFTGVAVNCAMMPLHTWVPDSYPQATPESQLFMGSYTTKAAVYAMIRFFAGTEWLAVFAAATAVLAACMALIENDLRKLLSYHIVSQVAMMLASVAAGGATGVAGAALHGAYNILYKGVLLMAAGNIFTHLGLRYITDMGGLFRRMPVTAVCSFIASLAIAGVPFSSGFAGKALITEALSEQGQTLAYILVKVAGVGTWLSVTMKINYFVFIKKPNKPSSSGRVKIPWYKNAAIIGATALVVITGIKPEICYSMLDMDSSHLFTADHVMEYIGLFAGATLTFAMLRRHMAPHRGINMDVDRFYRITLCRSLMSISEGVAGVFEKYAVIFDNFYRSAVDALERPGKVFGLRTSESKEESARSVGEMVHVLAMLFVIALIIILIID